MKLQDRQWIAYIGAFSFPEGSACTRRVLGNAQSLAEAGEQVVVGAVDTPEGPLTALPKTSLTAPAVLYQGLGAYSRAWSSARKVAAILWTSSVKTMTWLEDQPSRPKAVILYGSLAPFLRRLLPWCKANRVALICDLVEWYYHGQVIGGIWTPVYWSGEYAMRYMVPRCDGIIAISRLLENYYKNRGCRVIRIPPTTDVTCTPVNAPSRGNDDPISLVYAGVPGRKDLLANGLEALRQTDPQGKRFRLHLVGPDEQTIRKLSPKYPVDAVVIHGRKSHRETLEIVGKSDFSVLLRPDARYAHAGFPTKVVESMVCGTPVICNLTSDLGEHIRDGREGIVCKDHTPKAFAQALRTIDGMSREQLAAMRRAARAEAERAFDYRIYAKDIGQLVMDLTGRVG